MSLNNLIQSAVRTGFAAAGDLVKTATYSRVTGEVYNTTTLQNTKTTATASVEVIVTSYSAREVDNVTILPNDVKITLNAADITFVPSPGDSITVEGITYEVVTRQRGASAYVYQLQGRTSE